MDEDALEILKTAFAFYGLSDLYADISARFGDQIRGATDVNEVGVILADTDAFKNRFPANELLKKAGKPQMSVTEYLIQEGSYRRVLESRSMPPGFYDQPSDLQNFIAQGVSPDELGARIDLGYQAVRNAPRNVVDEFQRLYGVTEGDLAAYFIDPERAKPTFDKYEAERQARSAQISAQAQQQAQITLERQQAETLARAGITQETAQQGFTAISEQQGLFAPQMAGEQAVSQAEQIGATFGTNAAARQAIERRRRQRQAAFEAGGGVTETQQGVVGLRTVGQ